MPNPIVWLAKKAAGKVITSKVGKVVNEPYDPMYEMRPNNRGKLKRVRRLIPEYLSPEDKALVLKIRTWASRLDTSHSICGMRYGWSAVVGLIPGIGDILDGLLSLYVYHLCKKVDGGLDVATKAKMKTWIVVDVLVGLIPIVGDLVDASIKCNARNCRLVEDFLARKYGVVPDGAVIPSSGKLSPGMAESGKTNSPESVQGVLLPSASTQATLATGIASPPSAAARQPANIRPSATGRQSAARVEL